jgi:hypothetical protein
VCSPAASGWWEGLGQRYEQTKPKTESTPMNDKIEVMINGELASPEMREKVLSKIAAIPKDKELNAKPTPGPWQTDGRWISASDFRPGSLFLADCAVSSGYRSQEETQANARLIASAPTMYEAIRQTLDMEQPELPERIVSLLSAALNAAEGQQP